jgi:hypothetical protein
VDDTIHQKKLKGNIGYKRRCEWFFNEGQRRCPCCNVQLNWTIGYKNTATAEHLLPKSHGGTYHPKNILIICYECNQQRGNTDYIKWIAGSNFDKKQWLISRYTIAMNHYITSGRKINRDTKKKYDNHMKTKVPIEKKPEPKIGFIRKIWNYVKG